MNRIVLAPLAAAMLLIPASVEAGTVSLRWDPSPDEDLGGYIVYYGTASADYRYEIDVGNVEQYTVGDLEDCTEWFFAVGSYNTEGKRSREKSNEISGWPKPDITRIRPNSMIPGDSYAVVIEGANFKPGLVLDFDSPDLTAGKVEVLSCNELKVSVSVRSGATFGPTPFYVVNPDRTAGRSPVDIVEIMPLPGKVPSAKRADTLEPEENP